MEQSSKSPNRSIYLSVWERFSGPGDDVVAGDISHNGPTGAGKEPLMACNNLYNVYQVETDKDGCLQNGKVVLSGHAAPNATQACLDAMWKMEKPKDDGKTPELRAEQVKLTEVA